MFTLDERLNNDCIQLGESDSSILLLMNNAHFHWFILVPKTGKTEFYELDEPQQQELLREINALSEFIRCEYQPCKLNIATIGNIVSQMHIHVIGRQTTDPCWPGVVWGSPHKIPYTDEAVNTIRTRVDARLAPYFS